MVRGQRGALAKVSVAVRHHLQTDQLFNKSRAGQRPWAHVAVSHPRRRRAGEERTCVHRCELRGQCSSQRATERRRWTERATNRPPRGR
eukprot:6192947-Pyramimonas_sp.AAC.2